MTIAQDGSFGKNIYFDISELITVIRNIIG